MAYEVLECRVEEAGPGQLRLVTLLGIVPEEEVKEDGDGPRPVDDGLGEGPTRETVPDRIALALIAAGGTSHAGFELKPRVGGNESTFYRQSRTIATNAPDTPKRLRGWVVSPEHGRYALDAAVRRRLEDPEVREYWLRKSSRSVVPP